MARRRGRAVPLTPAAPAAWVGNAPSLYKADLTPSEISLRPGLIPDSLRLGGDRGGGDRGRGAMGRVLAGGRPRAGGRRGGRGCGAAAAARGGRGRARAGAGAPREVDVLVLGGGPVGSEVALACAMLGKTCAVAEPRGLLLSAPTGWVSKALRQLGRDHGAPNGTQRVEWAKAEEYLARTAGRALKLTANRFSDAALLAGAGWHAPEILKGQARFTGAHSALVEDEGEEVPVDFGYAFIAVGSASFRIPSLPWGEPEAAGWLFDGDTIKDIGSVPQKLVVQGGGTIATEYAFIFRALGADVTVVMRESRVMEGCGMDRAVQDAVMARMQRVGIEVRADTGDFSEVRPPAEGFNFGTLRGGAAPVRPGTMRADAPVGGNFGQVVLKASGEVLECDALLSATGRVGLAGPVNTEAAGCAPPVRGCAPVDATTMQCIGENTGHIFAVGDCEDGSTVTPQGLLSTGLAQAYIATHAAFTDEMEAQVGQLARYDSECPVAVWIEPTVSYVGMTTEAAEATFGPDGCGSVKVFFSETIKGCVERAQPYGRDEFYKVIYRISDESDCGRILGVHVYGSGASEFIHNAATLVNSGATVWEVCRTVPPAVTVQDVLKMSCVRAAIDISARGKGPRPAQALAGDATAQVRAKLLDRNRPRETE